MPMPPKPPQFSIFPGMRYLISSNQLISEADRATGAPTGMTESERIACENWAWEMLLMALIARYDVTDWGHDPPWGLERMFDLLASAYYRQMELGIQGVDSKELIAAPLGWIKQVDRDLSRISDPSDEGLNLIKSDGSVLRPRTRVNAPAVVSFDLNLFPGQDDEGPVPHVGQSLEELQKLHGRSSRTLGGPQVWGNV